MKNFQGYTGGHPLRLDNALILQEAYKEGLLSLARSFVPPSQSIAFLQGAVISIGGGSTSITDGWMLVDGDIYRVPAKTVGVTGLSNLKLVLITETPDGYPDTVTYRDSGPQEVYKETILDLRDTNDPDGEGDPIELDTYIYRVAAKPSRTIEMYAPSDALSNHFDSLGIGKNDCLGYALCDGQGGRPDLRGRFVVGFQANDTDYDTVGKTGGAKTVTLTAAQSGLPDHKHVQTGYAILDSGNNLTNGGSSIKSGNKDSTETFGVTDGAKNAQESHENRPPYYTVVYMIKL